VERREEDSQNLRVEGDTEKQVRQDHTIKPCVRRGGTRRKNETSARMRKKQNYHQTKKTKRQAQNKRERKFCTHGGGEAPRRGIGSCKVRGGKKTGWERNENSEIRKKKLKRKASQRTNGEIRQEQRPRSSWAMTKIWGVSMSEGGMKN